MELVTRFRPLFFFLAALLLIPALAGCPDDEGDDDPCEGVVCDDPPATTCDGDVVVSYAATGTCEEGECVYPQTRIPCGAEETCVDGACIPVTEETCADIEPCDTPPADFCDGDVVVTYEAEGTCFDDPDEGPYCVYEETRVPCTGSDVCEMIEGVPTCVPTELTCEDLEPCVTPPGPSCDENVAVNYEAEGTCVEGADGPECVYESVTTDCTLSETVCSVEGDAAVCVDLCEGVTCAARDDFCDGDVRVTYGGAAGDCAWETGECEYPADDETREACGELETCQMVEGAPVCVGIPIPTPCAETCAADTECGRAVDLCVVFEPAEGGYCSHSCEIPADCDLGFACEEVTSIDGTTANQCVPEIGYCLEDVVCGIGPAPFSVMDDGGYCEHPLCAGDPACEFGYNFDFETWIGDTAPGFYFYPEDLVTGTQDDTEVNTGDFSMLVSSTAPNQNRDLRAGAALPAPAVGAEYTYHAWVRFEPAEGSTDWLRLMMWLRDVDGSLNREGETGGAYWSILGDLINAPILEWTELTITSPPVEADRVDLRPMVRIRSRDATPTLAWTDDWALTLPYPFALDAANLDPSAVEVGSAANLFVTAAVNNEGVLYAGTQSVAELQDRFLYVWLGGVGTDTVAAPWNKAAEATVAGPAAGGELLALVQDNNAYCAWLRYDAGTAEWLQHSTGADDGTCTNTAGTFLAGTIDLASLLAVTPEEVPAWISFASAGYGQNDTESLIQGTQVPATLDDDASVDANETIAVHRASLLAGKVH